MAFKMRYVAPVFLLMLSLVGAGFCGYYMLNASSMGMMFFSATGVVAWLVTIRVCLYAIAKGRRIG